MASEAVYKGDAANVAHTTAMHGVGGTTKPAAREVAATGIRANPIAPGSIRTEMMDAAVAADPLLEDEVSR